MRTLILLAFSAMPMFGVAQTDQTAITEVINRLFTGMKNNDSSMVSAAFTKQVTLATIGRDKKNDPFLFRESSLDAFLKAVASPKSETWNEEIWNLRIEIDGDLASVWCDYAFYVGKTFSHCGVDAFHLHKTAEGWRIFHLADTRRKDRCQIPAEVERKYK